MKLKENVDLKVLEELGFVYCLNFRFQHPDVYEKIIEETENTLKAINVFSNHIIKVVKYWFYEDKMLIYKTVKKNT